jgi:hypothetical protein
MNDANDLDRLYRLLPAIYQMRDADQGYPLRALLRLIGREAKVLEDDLYQLYDGWFIETCPDWLVPYIGELIGYEPAPEAGDPANLDVSDPGGRDRVLIPRRDVANTIHDRRRKGTLALLETIAGDAAGWPARAVEFFRRLGWTQNINHLHPGQGGTADLQKGRALISLNGPFDEEPHIVDVRRPNSTLTPGRYNIPSVGLFVWRLRAYTVTRSRADCLEDIGPERYTFSALGNDTQLFNRPDPGAARVSSPLDLPVPITRRAFEERLRHVPEGQPSILSIASEDYYGLNKSLAIWVPDWPVKGAPQPVPRQSIIPANLTDWKYQTPLDHIAVDPELGRLTFPPRQLPKSSVSVSYAYGFAAPIGGGEYERPLLESSGAVVYRVGRDRPGTEGSIQSALQRWRQTEQRPKAALIEIVDSGVYTEPIKIELDEDEILQIRAANGARPIIRLLDYLVDLPDPFSISGRRGSRFTLDGLLVTGRAVAVQGPDPQDGRASGDDLCEVALRHCTLVPGWGLHNNCDPIRPAEPSLEIFGSQARVRIQHTILGSILISADRVGGEPIVIDLSDCILDATGHDCDRPECEALTAQGGLAAHAATRFRRCTVFGRVHTHEISVAENSIFTGQVRVARRQKGCMRFCYVPVGSRTPRRYECQPDKVTAGLAPGDAALEALRVQPQFMSVRYGTADYARLEDDCAQEIRQGADDQSEMGVYHDLYEPQRAALLRRRMGEFTPAEMDAGLIFET